MGHFVYIESIFFYYLYLKIIELILKRSVELIGFTLSQIINVQVKCNVRDAITYYYYSFISFHFLFVLNLRIA